MPAFFGGKKNLESKGSLESGGFQRILFLAFVLKGWSDDFDGFSKRRSKGVIGFQEPSISSLFGGTFLRWNMKKPDLCPEGIFHMEFHMGVPANHPVE